MSISVPTGFQYELFQLETLPRSGETHAGTLACLVSELACSNEDLDDACIRARLDEAAFTGRLRVSASSPVRSASCNPHSFDLAVGQKS